MRINPITNSPQRTQQKQQAFEAFRYTQPLEELTPIIERARNAGIKIITPDEIMMAIRHKLQEPPVFNPPILTKNDEETVSEMIKDYLFTDFEKDAIVYEARFKGLNSTIETIRDIVNVNNIIDLPINVIKSSVEIFENSTQEIRNNNSIIANARLTINTAEVANEKHIASKETQRKVLLGYGIIA